ncbi:hypothetical protein GYN07_20920 [Rhizobium leguminosarum bv. viciae 248]|uniref:hypothetical protein n=1 Tax=Rhizobium leguminosarum TaxID=384 RepID=UPI00035EA06E|nr:hypothetical protein [Rhizobium leguminosarum]QHW26645.1 hypothetical protein GYN07_20920 [Rhizobium leguminosarum bv. viciae 248]
MKPTAITGAVILMSLLIGATTSQAQDSLDFKCREFRPSLEKRSVERPEPPFCGTSFAPFFDEFSFNSCRSEMEQYRQKVADFADCLVDENKRAVKEFNDAVTSFNQRAGR